MIIGKRRGLQDRLYLNSGSGKFTKHNAPADTRSKSHMPADFDKGGDMISLSSRLMPGIIQSRRKAMFL
jgi:hypothetical protein